VEGWTAQFISSPVGWPFRRSFERQVAGVVCGAPYSKASVIVDAVDALTRLVVESLKEDIYGQVSGDVVGIIRSYLATLKAVQGYVKSATPHWSDVTFSEAKRAQVKDVNEVVEALSDGLAAVLGAFGEYLPSMGLASGETREVKALVAEAAARKAEATEKKETKKVEAVPRTNGAVNGATAPRVEEKPRRRERREMEQVR
jgi:nucleoporin NDC1